MFKTLFNKIRCPICNSKNNENVGWGANKSNKEFRIRHCNKCNTGFWLYNDGTIEFEFKETNLELIR